MRAIEVTHFGGPEALRLVGAGDPVSGEGQSLVRVAAATVNPADLATAAGAFEDWFPNIRPPFVLGWDFAGTLLEPAGDLPAGTRVLGLIPWFERPSGSYQEVVSVDPAWIAPLPDKVDFIEAATLPLNVLTGRQALDDAVVRAGQTVLVTGASGGVGGFAAESAAARGLRVIAIASVGDVDHVKALGADVVIERTPDWIDRAREGAGDGVDALIDGGGAGPAAITLVRAGGAFVTVNQSLAPQPERGISVVNTHVEPRSAELRRAALDFEAGALTVRVADVVPLADAADAFRRLAAGGFHGKLVLSV